MNFTENIDKLISGATERQGQLDAQRERLLKDRASIEQMLSRTIEEMLRVSGELKALETVRKGTTDSVPNKEN